MSEKPTQVVGHSEAIVIDDSLYRRHEFTKKLVGEVCPVGTKDKLANLEAENKRLREVMIEDHTMEDGVLVCFDSHEPCAVCKVLAETGGHP